MSSPATQARYLRGALVGRCSALLTGVAHCAAGGAVPGSGALALLLVGWFLPLLGLSLLAFVAVDAGIAAWKRRRSVNTAHAQPD